MFVWNKTYNKYFSYGEEITKEEYHNILAMLQEKPEAPEGCDYFLNQSLEWELVELPVVEEEATEQDYITALEKLGVYAYA